MFVNHWNRKGYVLLEENPGGEGGGGGGGGSNAGGSNAGGSNADSEEVKALVRQAVDEATAGLKSKNDELIAEKRRLQESAQVFDGVDKDQLLSFIDKMKNDEEAKLIADGKIDDVISKRTERMREALQARIDDASKATKDWEGKYSKLETQFHGSVINNQIRAAALEAKVLPSALDDVIARSGGKFQYSSESGRIVSKDPDTGEIKIGADGKSPYSPTDFMEDLKKDAPHFWPGSASGGFSGGFGESGAADSNEMKKALHSQGGFAEYKRMREEAKKK